ncbi:MAG: hypothetical protein EOP48_23220 [Sphingobacteriales bacterium]|nr:MAG: hypothetical protein EOP48_23220 [Sphingobacteriales bacterium]
MRTSNVVSRLVYQSNDTLRWKDQRCRFSYMVYHRARLYLMSSIVGSYGIEPIKMNNGKLDMSSSSKLLRSFEDDIKFLKLSQITQDDG